MDQMQYFKNVYSKFWANQSKNYGYEEYTRKLVEMIGQTSVQRVFEVGIGTGWPVGAALKDKGIIVDGCDVADSSVAAAQKELDNREGIWCGEVSEYRGRAIYDAVYCVRSSWYITDFYSTVRKMISMTKPGGYIIFDVMDQDSRYCLKLRMTGVQEKYFRFLGIDVDERYGMNFISIGKMKRFLNREGLSFQNWGERELTGSYDRRNTPKVVFVCRKELKT